jgi:hypothetical protein
MPEPTPSDISTDVSTLAPVARCPWCSAELPQADAARCPVCHAQLRSDQEPNVPGLTEVLPASVAKAQNQESSKRNRLLSWISGEVDQGDAEPEIPPEAVARPPLDVRREMLRLQLEAEGIITTNGVDDQAVEHPEAAAAGTSELTADGSAASSDPPASDAPVGSGAPAVEPSAGTPDSPLVPAAGSSSDSDTELQRAG